MTGLDKIIEQIKHDAMASADAIIAEGKAQAESVTAKANAEAEASREALKAQAEAELKLVVSRGESAAALYRKKAILEAKQQIIGEILEDAKKSLLELPDNEYFEIIGKMIARYTEGKKAEIIFNEKDVKRIPAGFESKLGGSTVSKETRAIDGGFILVFGDIEENCSFESLFASNKEDLTDKIRALLFE